MTISLLTEISNWKLDANREDPDRYFYEPEIYSSIESGQKAFVLGRKGTGKTAISHYLSSKMSYNRFSAKLDFKSFPFDILYQLRDSSFTAPHQYISVWKFVILGQLARLMAGNHAIDAVVRNALEDRFGGPDQSARRLLGTQREKSFGINLASLGGVDFSSRPRVEPNSWWQITDGLLDTIRNNLDNSKYYLLFDALDEDYRDMMDPSKRDLYLSLITGLFKAVDEVKADLAGFNVCPVVFLRDDIFDLISDSDRNKWSDISVNIDWRGDAIKRLLAFRIARSESVSASPREFSVEWRKAFTEQKIRWNQNDYEIFDFLLIRTYLRPRDFILYIRECAKVALEKGMDRIDRVVAFYTAPTLSEHVFREFVDELHPIIPDIDAIFEVLQKTCRARATFPFADFKQEFVRQQERGFLRANYPITPESIMRYFYYFSVVGNRTAHSVYFRSRKRFTDIDLDQPVTIHASLYSALGVSTV